MQLGLHLLEASRLPALEAAGVELPAERMGLLDALRMLEGHEPAPPAGRPLVLDGLDALLASAPADPGPLLRALRDALLEGRAWFAWKRVPVVLLLRGSLEDPQNEHGLTLALDGRRVPLAPLVGTRLALARPGFAGWYWSPQLA